MNTKPMVFDYGELNVRVVEDENGEPWFVAKDICEILEYSDTRRTMDLLDDDEKGRRNTPTPGGSQELWTINESGLYTLIIRSNKPEAKKFRKWVTSEVLPSLRKHGKYEMTQHDFNDGMETDPPLVGRIEMVSVNGYTLHIRDGRALIRDKELAAQLGYSNQKRIRGIIDNLIMAGMIEPEEVVVDTAITNGLIGGRPYRCYYLDERGAVKFAARSRLPGSGQVANDLSDIFQMLRDADLRLPHPDNIHQRGQSTPLDYTYAKAADMLIGFMKAGDVFGVNEEERRSRAMQQVQRITGVDFSTMLEDKKDEAA